ncbi:hypothetical protein HO173_010404 [Letharia columbiana]|uniref:Uncharacterized protein n=1 Tax=Letharia columbiana TaxID=112416 RepID=A0A8H6FMU2_9LECA|nr:uncharacterized protein HO173_010404 [Letharia columbiana]KAF6231443.1 hypothetical protein HO173_010404 [Letharia columbiana]
MDATGLRPSSSEIEFVPMWTDGGTQVTKDVAVPNDMVQLHGWPQLRLSDLHPRQRPHLQ